MNGTTPTIFIVDDDPSIRESTRMMLESAGFYVKTFTSAEEFLKANLEESPGCLILDVRMPGLSGLDLQEKLASRKTVLPIIFITGHGTIPMSVRAMKAGAVDFLQKPFEEQDLFDAINTALSQQRAEKLERDESDRIQQCIRTLTSREYEVFSLLTAGMANKVIALKLGTTERTIKFHRARIMNKMSARSFADLIRFSEIVKNRPPKL